jgi:TDG/mug DNA glycosylase family protein
MSNDLKRSRPPGVGLWDVIASAERPGSLDAAIRSPEAADLRGLVRGPAEAEAVGFNGATSAKGGRKAFWRGSRA